MKHKAEFDEFIDNSSPDDHLNDSMAAWEACEDFYDSQKCKDCEHSTPGKELLLREDCYHCGKVWNRMVPPNFSCKYWEKKK